MSLSVQERDGCIAELVKLEAQLLLLVDDEAGLGDTVDLDQSRMGRVSRIDAMQHQKMAKANVQRAKIRLQRVSAVLLRARANPEAYGLCVECDDPISLGRLSALPDALMCMDCTD